MPISFSVCFQVTVCLDFCVENSTLVAPNSRCWHRRHCKKQFLAEIICYAFRGRFFRFLEALGPVFLVFATLETGLKINGF